MEDRNSLTPFASTPDDERRRSRVCMPVVTTLLWLAAAGAVFNCGGAGAEIDRAERTQYRALLNQHARSGQQALRVKADPTRKRLWVLTLQDVFVYDLNAEQAVKRIALPAWSVAGIQCPPDLVLDAAGSALISSNAEPRLWKIDAETFGAQEHVIRLLDQENRDGGFGALAYAGDGSLVALSSFAGSLWRIDLVNSSAGEIKLSSRLSKVCTLNVARHRAPSHNLTLCATSDRGARRIEVAADFKHARVSPAVCND